MLKPTKKKTCHFFAKQNFGQKHTQSKTIATARPLQQKMLLWDFFKALLNFVFGKWIVSRTAELSCYRSWTLCASPARESQTPKKLIFRLSEDKDGQPGGHRHQKSWFVDRQRTRRTSEGVTDIEKMCLYLYLHMLFTKTCRGASSMQKNVWRLQSRRCHITPCIQIYIWARS